MSVIDTIRVVRGDITKIPTDAIVNAANESLLGGGGVDGAIHTAAGPELLEECKELCGCPTGEAKVTKAYRLPAKFVIHTVGPVWRGGIDDEHRLLGRCYRRSLEEAAKRGCRTIAFPAISCGAYGFPVEHAARTAVRAVTNYLSENDFFEEVDLVCFDEKTEKALRHALDERSQELTEEDEAS